jgi:hypothetical protein
MFTEVIIRVQAWTNISGNLPDVPANAFAVDNNIEGRIYIGLDALELL